jgi:hypothetical protein
VAHNQRVRPPGLWTASSVLLAAEVEQLDHSQFIELHEGGGTWALQGDVTIGAVGAAAWRFTAPLVVSDLSGHVIAGKTLSVDPFGALAVGGVLDLHGLGWVQPGALLEVKSASPTAFGSIVVDVGALLGVAGSMYVTDFGQPGPAGTITLGTGVFGAGHLVVTQWGDVTFKSGSTLAFEAIAPFATITGYARWLGPGGLVLEGTTHVLGSAVFREASTTSFVQGAKIIFQTPKPVTIDTSGQVVVITGPAVWKGPDGLTLEGPSGVSGSFAFKTGSTITGQPKLASGATFTVAKGAKLALASGSTFTNAGNTTRSGPEDRSGSKAVTGLRPKTGPNGKWTVDGEAYDWVLIPVQGADRTWNLAAPQNQQRAIEFTITALTPALNASVQIVFGATPLCRFTNSPGRWAASVTFGWEPTTKQWLIKDATPTEIVGGAGSALTIPGP